MPAIATLTLNPAIDVSTSVARVEPWRKLRCAEGQRDPGGGGLNVARVAGRLGARATAVYPVGGLAGAQLKALAEREGLTSRAVPVRGETREDFAVRDETSGEQFRFVLPGPQLTADELSACLGALEACLPGQDFVCASGSLPPGAPADLYGEAARLARRAGVRLALDTSGAPLRAALGPGVFLIKPNQQELRELTGEALVDDAARIRAARNVIGRGGAEVVALTLGVHGALLITADRAWTAQALQIPALSTVGAGDSFLGALVWALSAGMTLPEAFAHGVAAGAAALMAPGTALAHAADVRRLVADVKVTPCP